MTAIALRDLVLYRLPNAVAPIPASPVNATSSRPAFTAPEIVEPNTIRVGAMDIKIGFDKRSTSGAAWV